MGAPRRDPAARLIDKFGPYVLLKRLPAGSMAEVHIAQKISGGPLCVLKRLRLSLTDHEPAGKRLYREAHLASHLRHDNIAQILDAGVEQGTFYLATELVGGCELAALLDNFGQREERIPLELALRVASDVLVGLEYAHHAVDPSGEPLQIVHRDLAPRNVMVGFDGVVKIIDFGAAHSDVDDFNTKPGTILGTPRYIAPEMVRGEPFDQRSDLYAVSVWLFEMLTGRFFFQSQNVEETLIWTITKPPPRLTEYDPSYSKELEAVIVKGLAKTAAKRWQSAAELRDALLGATPRTPPMPRAALSRIMQQLFPREHNRWTMLVQASGHGLIVAKEARMSTADDMPAVDPNEEPTQVEPEASPLQTSSDVEQLVPPAPSPEPRPTIPMRIPPPNTSIPVDPPAAAERAPIGPWVVIAMLLGAMSLLAYAIFQLVKG